MPVPCLMRGVQALRLRGGSGAGSNATRPGANEEAGPLDSVRQAQSQSQVGRWENSKDPAQPSQSSGENKQQSKHVRPKQASCRATNFRTADGSALRTLLVAAASLMRQCACIMGAWAEVSVLVRERLGRFLLGALVHFADGLKDFVSLYVDGMVAFKDGGLYGMLMWAKREWDQADDEDDQYQDKVAPMDPSQGLVQAAVSEESMEDADKSEADLAEACGDELWEGVVQHVREKLGTDIDQGMCLRSECLARPLSACRLILVHCLWLLEEKGPAEPRRDPA